MKFKQPITLEKLAEQLRLEYSGSGDIVIEGLNEINVVEHGDIIFVDHPKYYKKALESAASVIIIDQVLDFPPDKGLIISKSPFDTFNQIIKDYRDFRPSSVAISRTAKIGDESYVQPGAYIGDDVVIGKGTIIHANVVIYDKCIIGDNVTIHANSVIGSDGFYFNKKGDQYTKFSSGGSVVIEDNVEIGAGCTLDRGVTNKTLIGKGTKLDNQVHIGHDTIIGENCLIAAQTGIAGACKIGNNVIMWGQVGVISSITIGDNAVIFAQSGIGKDVPENATLLGSPADNAKTRLRELASLRKLPDIIKSFH
ncbi:MAG: UDP-3-O-(3-hydroxymyristoyl)glucosamine N-acyltransferase [Flavobacteriales bacterium]|nr:UDP-3-O-(3-hydroxymyristoyl)glucosamine N-acyltransferase [Flavobacteriales bacterium]